MAEEDAAGRVVRVAKSWKGKEFHPGESAQCAPFVRHVFAEANVPLGNTSHPSDMHLLYASDGLSPNFADSFAGDDVGRRVTLAEALPGDIVMFKNTYGNWRDGVITHVGIYVGNNMMIDRSTSSQPVRERSVYTFSGGPCEIRRPKAFDQPCTRLEYVNGKVIARLRSAVAYSLDIKLHLKQSLMVAVNNAPVKPKAMFLKVKDSGTGQYYRFSLHKGAARASANERPVNDFMCHAKYSGGALHVYINGNEVRSREVAIEIVHTS